jgi:hypothetical protein
MEEKWLAVRFKIAKDAIVRYGVIRPEGDGQIVYLDEGGRWVPLPTSCRWTDGTMRVPCGKIAQAALYNSVGIALSQAGPAWSSRCGSSPVWVGSAFPVVLETPPPPPLLFGIQRSGGDFLQGEDSGEKAVWTRYPAQAIAFKDRCSADAYLRGIYVSGRDLPIRTVALP